MTTAAHTSQFASLATGRHGLTGFLVSRFQCICLLTAYRHISLNAISLNVPWYYKATYDSHRPERRIGHNPAPILSQTPETASRPPESGEPESPNPPGSSLVLNPKSVRSPRRPIPGWSVQFRPPRRPRTIPVRARARAFWVIPYKSAHWERSGRSIPFVCPGEPSSPHLPPG